MFHKINHLSIAMASFVILASIALAGTATVNAAGKSEAQSDATTTDPLFTDFQGVRLGMTATEVRQILGKPRDADESMDYFVFSDERRARVYYDAASKAEAIVATFIGSQSGAPPSEDVLGTGIVLDATGSGSKKIDYPSHGYWVAYSRTAGDDVLVTITMKAF